MKRFLVAFALLSTALTVVPAQQAGASTDALRQWVSDRIVGHKSLSQGARQWLKGPPSSPRSSSSPRTPSFGTNVDAADPNEDLISGQSETAIAASGQTVVAAWNDATGFAFNDSTQAKASFTGVGFSSDGGASFQDLVGLPNPNPDQQWMGDPMAIAIDSRHFLVGGLYFPSFFTACSDGNPSTLGVAVSVGTLNGLGTNISFSSPIFVAQGGDLCAHPRPHGLALLDKPFMAYDPTSRTLAVTYTRDYLRGSGLGEVDVARAHVPAVPSSLTQGSFHNLVVWHQELFCLDGSEANQCGALNTGAYPAVAPDGKIYVAWERNIESNLFFSGDPYVYIHAAVIPRWATEPTVGGNTSPFVVTQGQVNSNSDGGVKSLDGTAIAGFSRGLGQDFPRVAFDAQIGRPIVVWNDASAHPLGDIWMRALGANLGSAASIHRVNSDGGYALHFLPAVSIRSNGKICSSWYDRRRSAPDSTETDYFGECRPNPWTQSRDYRITTGATDWSGTSSFISPNFGDYTDNASTGTTTYFIWSDGRLGVPQPFVDSNG
ncbi:MAG: hypothetical protein QOE83_2089 [Actinomycetota bacterium]|nr:hypothetical protein [Actinomycetota bacterium]